MGFSFEFLGVVATYDATDDLPFGSEESPVAVDSYVDEIDVFEAIAEAPAGAELIAFGLVSNADQYGIDEFDNVYHLEDDPDPLDEEGPTFHPEPSGIICSAISCDALEGSFTAFSGVGYPTLVTMHGTLASDLEIGDLFSTQWKIGVQVGLGDFDATGGTWGNIQLRSVIVVAFKVLRNETDPGDLEDIDAGTDRHPFTDTWPATAARSPGNPSDYPISGRFYTTTVDGEGETTGMPGVIIGAIADQWGIFNEEETGFTPLDGWIIQDIHDQPSDPRACRIYVMTGTPFNAFGDGTEEIPVGGDFDTETYWSMAFYLFVLHKITATPFIAAQIPLV